ncbi:TolC family protein [Stigmatella sp. ncwal1]|uniref:TolC family protein n=1 Tax=Stigmatella ashevillensis TaxID=2995309 RepID=A0ABT5D3K0_9BACT|nr:TolC family protein [Stigmatella ashevillena]MDC0707698.1 TolC family protein [Stigmatella ashevillena]
MATARFFFVSTLSSWLLLAVPEARAQASDPAASAEPLTLEQAIQRAAERNEAPLAAQQRSEAAEARVARARAFFFPELSLTGTYTRRLRESVRQVGGETTVIQRYNALGAAATARVVLFDARGFPLYRAARLEGDAAKLDAREARRLVTFEAADAFLATLGTQQVYEAAVRRLDFARQSLQDAQARAQAGLASTNDVTRAELEAASAEVQLAASRGDAQTSRIELGYLLVAPPIEGPLVLPESLLAEASRAPQTLTALAQGAVDRRLDILSAKLKVQALESAAKEPLARLLPALGVSGQYRFTNEQGLAGNSGDGSLQVDLTWTLFDGGERYAERREQVALARATALETTALTRRVDVDIQRAQVALDNAQAALRQSELAAQQARKNAEETGILYRQGLSTALTVADASLRLFEAEVAQVRTRYALGVALLDLRAAVGLDPFGKEP